MGNKTEAAQLLMRRTSTAIRRHGKQEHADKADASDSQDSAIMMTIMMAMEREDDEEGWGNGTCCGLSAVLVVSIRLSVQATEWATAHEQKHA